jgi:hypothetical protein
MEYIYYVIFQYVLGIAVLGEVYKDRSELGRHASNLNLPDDLLIQNVIEIPLLVVDMQHMG